MAKVKRSSLMSKMLKVDKCAMVLSESNLLDSAPLFHSSVPMINLFMSGSFDGGMGRGITQFVGESKTFKTGFLFVMANDFLRQNPNGIVLFFDSEMGAATLVKSSGIDKDRVVHIPILNIEDLKQKVSAYLDEVEYEDDVLVIVDSIGTLPSIKEINDALTKNTAADMTRAKELNSFFRIIDPPLNIKNIPCIILNTMYLTMEKYAKTIVKGGGGSVLASENIFLIGKRQVKDNKELLGFDFVLKAFKSRYCKENSVLPVTITFDGGIDLNSGILDVAIFLGFVISPKVGFFALAGTEAVLNKSKSTKNKECWEIPCKRKKMLKQPFFDALLADEEFRKAAENMYSLSSNKLLQFLEDEDSPSA